MGVACHAMKDVFRASLGRKFFSMSLSFSLFFSKLLLNSISQSQFDFLA